MTSLETRTWPYGEQEGEPVQEAAPPTHRPRRRWLGLLGMVVLVSIAAVAIAGITDRANLDFLPLHKDHKPTMVLGIQTDPLHAAWPYIHPPREDAMITSCADDPQGRRGLVTLRVINYSLDTARYSIWVRVVSGTTGRTVAIGRALVAPLLPNESSANLTTITKHIPPGSSCRLSIVHRIPVA